VLLVDDEAHIREPQAEFLQYEGHATLEAANGKEALELARRFRPDLIVTDLMMPVMNGWRLLASLRQADIEVPVILITGYMSQEGQEVLASKDIAGFLVKPVDLEELADMVRRVLFPQSLNRRRRILAVDDQEDMLLFIGMQLRQAGFEVETALSGAEALAKAGSYKPDLVLLDIVMPQMDGFAVCQRLRSRPETADVPVVMLAAKTSAEHVRRAVALKVNGYLVKPFDPEVLVTRIRRVLEGAGKG
jgi:DNA-binding response OmpR family regulator